MPEARERLECLFKDRITRAMLATPHSVRGVRDQISFPAAPGNQA
jgi:hypothetical protein